MREIIRDGKPSWYGQPIGGPTITLLFCVRFDRENHNFISEGSVHHYPSYYFQNLPINKPPSTSISLSFVVGSGANEAMEACGSGLLSELLQQRQ
jgi:hypothetical protein